MKSESQKEYGGCLYFETSIDNKEYYSAWDKCKIDVDSGRSALQFILENYNFKRIWLPVYNCPLVGKRIEQNPRIEICWYNIDDNFRPIIDKTRLLQGDCLLWVNYCGVMPQALIDEIVALQERTPVKVIVDNIPAYFSQPRMSAFNIYSCRKFIGVPDGGHIIGNAIEPKQLPTYSTARNYFYLLKAMESGSNSAYEDYQKSESRFTESDIAYGMPILTQKMLKSVNYGGVIKKRKSNFNILYSSLNESNRLKLDAATMTPSVYPYLTSNKNLREKLLENKIYVSRFWKHVLTNKLANEFEKDLAEYLIPLPIDQRYDESDMQYIATMVKRWN